MPSAAYEKIERPRTAGVSRETPDIASSSEDYASRFSGSVGRFFLETQNKIISQFIGAQPTRVLDVGGGHAQLAPILHSAGHEVTILGSDGSCEELLKRAMPRNSYQFVTGDILSLPFDDNAFDVVVAIRMLPHLNDWQRLIQQCCRVAKLSVIFDYPDKRSANALADTMFSFKKRIERNTRPFRCFHRQEISGELTQNGFELTARCPQFFYPMALHRALRFGFIARTKETVAKAIGLTSLLGSPVIVRAEPAGGAA